MRNTGHRIHVVHADLNIAYWKTHGLNRVTFTESDSLGNQTIIRQGTYWPKNSSFFFHRWISAYANWVVRHIENLGPDVLHAHTYLGAAICKKINKSLQIPYLTTLHYTGWLNGQIRAEHLKIGLDGLQGARHVVCVSKALQHKMKSEFNISSQIIPNFIDESVFHPPMEKRKCKPFVILGVGDLIPRKQWHLLLSSFQKVQKLIPEARLKIVGSGPERAQLEKQAVNLQISDSVQFVGQLNMEEIAKEYRSANLLVHTSRTETFGLTILEALNCGLPVLCFANGASEELLEGVNHSFIVEKNDIVALSERIYQLYQNYDRIEFESIRQTIPSRYKMVEAIDSYNQLYSDCVTTC